MNTSKTPVMFILLEMNTSNSSNHKLDVLKRFKNNTYLMKVLSYTFDRVKYTYGLGQKSIGISTVDMNSTNITDFETSSKYLDAIFEMLEQFNNRTYTGNAAIEKFNQMVYTLKEKNALDIVDLLYKIVNRDLKINIGKTQINKVYPNLITDLPYMRCGTYNNKSIKKIQFPAYVQLKADGTYRSVVVNNGEVSFISRSGEISDFSNTALEKVAKSLPDGVYIGECLVQGINYRSVANGLINSDNKPEQMYMQLWDFLTLDEWSKGKSTTKYSDRLNTLTMNVKKALVENNYFSFHYIQIIETKIVQNVQEALQITLQYMSEDLEGSIIKNMSAQFKDGTSAEQLKCKLKLDLDVKITGFLDGRIGSKREGTIGSIEFESEDGLIKGRCSGFTDKELADFNSRKDELIGTIMTVEFNDITKAVGSETFALSHPRFMTLRTDKTTADTFQRALEIKTMACQIRQ